VRVEPADIDTLGHVNNVVYLRWVQEVATAHWKAAAPAALQADLVWVVLRHEIDYARPAMPQDEIVARTWVGEATGTRFERFVDIVRASDGVALAHARTIWCPINVHSGSPQRLDPSLHEYFSEPASA
jgi:acyl-CoA thioester hydrolase